jgi:uncharacterized protein (UPF0305 family)
MQKKNKLLSKVKDLKAMKEDVLKEQETLKENLNNNFQKKEELKKYYSQESERLVQILR